jgi:hypothetical protein
VGFWLEYCVIFVNLDNQMEIIIGCTYCTAVGGDDVLEQCCVNFDFGCHVERLVFEQPTSRDFAALQSLAQLKVELFLSSRIL